MIEGSKPSFHPGFVSPQLAILDDAIPSGAQWVHEFKFDGYRLQAHKKKGVARLYTRGGHEWTHKFRHIAQEVQRLPAENLIIDGEIVSATKTGLADFSGLQADLAAGDQSRMVFYAFDILYLDGFDLRDAPLIARKDLLASFLAEADVSRILLSEHFEDGRALLKESCRIGGEGVVSKKRDARYRSTRAKTWLKIKCRRRDVFTIVGFIPQRKDGIAALRLARKRGRHFEYMGKAGTGFTVAGGAKLRKILDAIVVEKPSLTEPIRKPDTIWVQPKVKADIAYAEITRDGRLRHASFKGLVK